MQKDEAEGEAKDRSREASVLDPASGLRLQLAADSAENTPAARDTHGGWTLRELASLSADLFWQSFVA